MKLSTRSRYGTRLLVDLARHDDQAPIQIGEISKRQGISVKYLEQLIRLFETHTDLAECINSPEKCDMSDECRVRLVWQEATHVLYQKLDSTSIADLAKET
jgi:DNA-binding IscR family transcriptional regulator